MSVAKAYRSATQIARVVSESWYSRNGYCLACDETSLTRTPPNTKFNDFLCPNCGHTYELKAFRKRPRTSLVDGAYEILISRIMDGSAPTLLLLQRNASWIVESLTAVHSVFLTPSVIEQRKPLSATARRAGWIGCNIRLDRIGPDGEVSIIEDCKIRPAADVRRQFRGLIPLGLVAPKERGWTTLTLSVVRGLSSTSFSLSDLYARESIFRRAYPGNRHVRAKLRQQLQVLRDLGIVEFLGRGQYRLIGFHAGGKGVQRGPSF